MKTTKTILALLLAVVMMFSFAACSTGTPAATEPDDAPDAEEPVNSEAAGGEEAPVEGEEAVPADGEYAAFDNYPHPVVKDPATDGFKLAYVHLYGQSEGNDRYQTQMEIEYTTRGWEFIDCEIENTSQFRTAFETAMNQGADAIICGVTDGFESYADLVAQARNQGIGVYCKDNMVIDGVITNLCDQNAVATMRFAYVIGDDYGWDVDWCVLSGSPSPHLVKMKPFEGLLTGGGFPNFTLLEADYTVTPDASGSEKCQTQAKAWYQKYKDTNEGIMGIMCCAPDCAIQANEAFKTLGVAADEFFIATYDDGPSIYSYMREADSNILYSYSQPLEAFVHYCCELISQIQIEGMNPGDEGCLIEKSGDMLYVQGSIVTKDSVPAIGDSIHTAFDYYDPSDADAWYMWMPENQYIINQ